MLTHGNGSKGSGLPDTDMPPVRLPRSVVEALDEFRQLQSDRPSRSDARPDRPDELAAREGLSQFLLSSRRRRRWPDAPVHRRVSPHARPRLSDKNAAIRRVPSLTSRTNTGLGFETARMLAEHGAVVVMAVRDVAKGQRAAARINGDVRVQALDLSSLDSVRAAAADLRAPHPRDRPADQQRRRDVHPAAHDRRRLRAAVRHQPPRPLRPDRAAARPPAGRSPGSRIVTVSSDGHRMRAAIHFDDLQWRAPLQSDRAPTARPSSPT